MDALVEGSGRTRTVDVPDRLSWSVVLLESGAGAPFTYLRGRNHHQNLLVHKIENG